MNAWIKRIESLEAENLIMRALLSRWLEFSADVRPSCMAGEEWLEGLRSESESILK
jgi:hypothetical protein